MSHRINPFKLFIGSFIPNFVFKINISAGAKLCYGRLMQYAGRDGQCFPSVETLAGELNTSTRQIYRYIQELESNNLLESERHGFGKNNTYFFLHHPAMDDNFRTDTGSQTNDAPAPDNAIEPAPVTPSPQNAESVQNSHFDKCVNGDVTYMSHMDVTDVSHIDMTYMSGHTIKENHNKKNHVKKSSGENFEIQWPEHFTENQKQKYREWIDYRKTVIRKPLKDSTIQRQLKFLSTQPDVESIIDRSIDNQYIGLFPTHKPFTNKTQTRHGQKQGNQHQQIDVAGNHPVWKVKAV